MMNLSTSTITDNICFESKCYVWSVCIGSNGPWQPYPEYTLTAYLVRAHPLPLTYPGPGGSTSGGQLISRAESDKPALRAMFLKRICISTTHRPTLSYPDRIRPEDSTGFFGWIRKRYSFSSEGGPHTPHTLLKDVHAVQVEKIRWLLCWRV